MKTYKENLDPKLCTYDLALLGNKSDILFMDIETTGFAARSSVLYMIGCVYFEGDTPVLEQLFSQKPDEESRILVRFIEICREKKILIHYNGNNFDIPYLRHKCSYYGYNEPFSDMEGVDIYKRIMPYKSMLGVDNLKQKTMEKFLGIEREDAYNGGELINIYREYVTGVVMAEKSSMIPADNDNIPTQYDKLASYRELLLLHNADDIRGMMMLLSLLSYADITLRPFSVNKVSAKKITEPTGTVHNYLIIRMTLATPLPKKLSVSKKGCHFTAAGDQGELEIVMYSGELKYFYSNYKEYYYLPEEDMALHKSVAGYVSPDHRTQATAENCYTRKEGMFLPQWDLLFDPVFKTAYKDDGLYFELTEEFRKNPSDFALYARHILDMLCYSKSKKIF